VGWAALGIVSYFVLAAIYVALVFPDAQQTVVEDIGAHEGTFGTIAAGFIVICVAPFAEEFFFRGFSYRALRSRFRWSWRRSSTAPCSASCTTTSQAPTRSYSCRSWHLVGFMFCLVYEKTGTIWPGIALHAFINTIAYGVAMESLVLGPLMLVACALLPRLGAPSPALR
jgi:membrane protease YdiL (CAAX protease family)